MELNDCYINLKIQSPSLPSFGSRLLEWEGGSITRMLRGAVCAMLMGTLESHGSSFWWHPTVPRVPPAIPTSRKSTRMSAFRVSAKQRPLFPKKLKQGRLLSTTVTPAVLWCGDARPTRRSGEGMWRIQCLTGGVCSGCWPSPPIWPRYLLKELTCLGGLAGTGVPDGMWMCVVCRLSFSQINVKFVKRRRGGKNN